MMLETTNGVTYVQGTSGSQYVLQPIARDLGLTDVEMVDDHLATLVRDNRRMDADRLLDVRNLLTLCMV